MYKRQAHARISLKKGQVKEIIERYGIGKSGELPAWFVRNVQQPYRTAVRDIVHKYDAYEIRGETQAIGMKIIQRLQKTYEGTPIVFETMSIGNLTYPASINTEIQLKVSAEEDLKRMKREEQIAVQQAKITVTTARGRAAAQKIVNETLTPLYVQHEMIEGFKELSHSPRVTVVATPVGGSQPPIILNQ